MIKTADKVLDKKNPADAEEIEALFDQLESEEVQESMAHLQQTIKTIEAALDVIKQRDFNEMSEEELAEVGEVIQNLDKFKIEMNMLVDDYLGQGALIQASLPEDIMAEPPSQFVGWGARDPSDPDFAFAPPTIPLAEASIENSVLKELVKVANELDGRGLVKEADKLDKIIKEAFSCLLLALGLFGCKDQEGEGVVFEFEDTGGYGCPNKISVSKDAEMVEDTQTSVSYKWYCVDPDDPYNDSGEYADITLQFDKEGPKNNDEIAEAVSNGADAQEVLAEIAVYCFNENPRVAGISPGNC